MNYIFIQEKWEQPVQGCYSSFVCNSREPETRWPGEGYANRGTSVQQNVSERHKRTNGRYMQNMDASQRHYAEREKPALPAPQNLRV